MLSELPGSSAGFLKARDDHDSQTPTNDTTELKEPLMTTTRLAIAGAIVLPIPALFAVTALSAGAVVTSVILLAAIGAVLGAATGWAIATPAEAGVIAAAPAQERLAA
jgi:membrane protein YqaA with SNARE-associated domain